MLRIDSPLLLYTQKTLSNCVQIIDKIFQNEYICEVELNEMINMAGKKKPHKLMQGTFSQIFIISKKKITNLLRKYFRKYKWKFIILTKSNITNLLSKIQLMHQKKGNYWFQKQQCLHEGEVLEQLNDIIPKDKAQFENKKSIIKQYEYFNSKLNLAVFQILDFGVKGDLFNYREKHKNSHFIQKQQIVLKILKGIQFMHQNGIIHGDLKLENIVLNEQEDPMIIDFQFAKNLGEKFNNKGTLAYIHPCIFQPTKLKIDKSKSKELIQDQYFDLYALGVITYLLYHDGLPFSQILNCNIEEEKKQFMDQVIYQYLQKGEFEIEKGTPLLMAKLIELCFFYPEVQQQKTDNLIKQLSKFQKEKGDNSCLKNQEEYSIFSSKNYDQIEIIPCINYNENQEQPKLKFTLSKKSESFLL